MEKSTKEKKIMSEWKYEKPNWKAERRCNHCRLPPPTIFKDHEYYKPVKCRDCIYIDIWDCIECGKTIGNCTYGMWYNHPPIDIDKEKKCIRYKERE